MSEKVPDARSQAGPGCWQCADCGKIINDKKDDCPRCSMVDHRDESEVGGDSGPTSKQIEITDWADNQSLDEF